MDAPESSDASALNTVKRLDDAARNLLDLTLRNRLVKYNPTKRLHVEVYPGEVGVVFQALTDDEPAPLDLEPVPSASAEGASWRGAGDGVVLPSLPYVVRKVQGKDGEEREEDPEKRIRVLVDEARVFEAEHGHAALYMAVGLLHWSEQPGLELMPAPFVLVPVRVQRGPRNQGYQVVGIEEPAKVNPALQLKLREQEVQLPSEEFLQEQGLEAFVREVQENIATKDWHLEPRVVLGMFKFHKFVMYQDLRALSEQVQQGQELPGAVRAVLDPDPDDPRLDGSPTLREEDVDERIAWLDARYILDADPSQIVAIEEVKAGKHMVVQGPPGTGKSQSIANLIAELLGDGKSVLFVSEKEAALEVVKRRLDEAGIGDFCLPLHGVRTTHKEFRAQMAPLLDEAFRVPARPAWDQDAFVRSRAQLDEYAKALATVPEGAARSVGWAVSLLASQKGRTVPILGYDVSRLPSEDDLRDARHAADERARWAKRWRAAEEHPWAWSRLTHENPMGVLDRLLAPAQEAVAVWQTAAEALSSRSGLFVPRSSKEMQQLVAWAGELADAHDLPGIQAHADLHELHAFSQECMAALADLLQRRDEMQKRGIDYRTDKAAAELRDAIEELAAKFLHWLRPSYWRTRREALSVYEASKRVPRAQLVDDLEQLAGFQAHHDATAPLRERAVDLGHGEDWDRLLESMTALVAWLVHVLASVKRLGMPEELASVLADQKKAAAYVEAIQAAQAAWAGVVDVMEDVRGVTLPDRRPPFGDLDDPTPTVAEAFVAWYPRNRETLGPWVTLRLWQLAAAKSWLSGLATVDPARPDEAELRAGVDAAVAQSIFQRGQILFPSLNLFDAAEHEHVRSTFQDLDARLKDHARHHLGRELVAEAQAVVAGARPGTPMATLRWELNRKRNRMTTRNLVRETMPALRRLKPCFMMSPITVSTFLDPASEPFDVLVFDEASQVRPEDALVCLMRARQVVVVGDSKQLPPTSFFDAADADEDEDDAVQSVSDMESILDACVNKGFPERTLRWHYRSRHHSLIEGSNQEFYHGRLLVFHSPLEDVEHMGLRHHHSPDSAYGEGGQGVNRREAAEVARLVHEHWKQYADKAWLDQGRPRSLGVVAFSMAQRQRIRDELDRIARMEPEFRVWLEETGSESFLLRNLENVQGDERDRIIVSVGYGRDQTGRIMRRFGPINKEGGERRLNVLFTRAREQTLVVSNFRSGELNLGGISARGPHVLKQFLSYAETGKLPVLDEEGGEVESPFEEEVLDMLEKNGYRVTPQVGCRGYRIDLAVHHPKAQGQYCAAVECDGATYHSSRVARERDRQRQEVLERMGWTVIRVWSTEWYHRPESARRKLLEAVAGAAKADPSTIGLPTSQATPGLSLEPVAPEMVPLAEGSNGFLEPYEAFEADGLDGFGWSEGLHEVALRRRMDAVLKVVEHEAPVHVDVVVQRLRVLSGQARAGSRARTAVEEAIYESAWNGHFARGDDGFLRIKGQVATARRRDSTWKPHLIAPEEYDAVLERVVREGIRVPLDSAFQAARDAIGFGRLGKDLKEQLERSIERLVGKGRLQMEGDLLRLPVQLT